MNFTSIAVLVFFRLLPLFVVSPIASFRRVPGLVRVTLCLLLALIMAGPIAKGGSSATVELSFFVLVQEFFVGMVLAYGFHAAVAVVQFFGQLIDFQIGFSAGAVFDPSTEQMASLTGELLTMSLLVVFLYLNVHHLILLGLHELNTIIPLGLGVQLNSEWIYVLGEMFALGFIIASPVVITLWLFDIGLAFVSRSLPQAQVYFVALPIKVGIGILALAWFSTGMLQPFHRLFSGSLAAWNTMIGI